MASAVTVTFSANSAQFQAELKRMEAMTRAAASGMSGGIAGAGGHGPRGMTGIIRESTVISREILMGRGLGRILGSMSLLVQYISSAASAHKGLDQSAIISANLMKEEAKAAQDLAKQLEAKATASALVADKTKQDAQAALNVVNHYEDEAKAARIVADELKAKAAASTLAADAAKEAEVQAAYGKILQKISLGQPVQLPVEITGVGNMKGLGKEKIDALLAVTNAKNEILKEAAETESAETAALQANAVADTEAAAAAEANAAAMTFKAGVAEQTLAATVENVAATEALAAADLEASTVQVGYAVTLTETAVAEHMAAIGAAEMEAASLPLLPLLIGLAVIAITLYGAFKVLFAVLNQFKERQIDAAELSRKLSLTFSEEAAVLEKLADAAIKTKDAIEKMSRAHDDYAKRVDVAVDAQKAFYDHTKKMLGLAKEADLTNVEIAEKQGRITHQQAIIQKGEIEKSANQYESDVQSQALKAKADLLLESHKKAEDFAKLQRDKAQAASEAADSPDAQANALELARLQRIEKETRTRADEAADAAAKMPENTDKNKHLKNVQQAFADSMNTVASMAADQVRDQRAKMHPNELAAADAMEAAGEATTNARTIGEQHAAAVSAMAEHNANAPSEVAAENANVDLKTQAELLSSYGPARGYGLNEQQRIGAYAATPPEMKQQVDLLKIIAANTAKPYGGMNPPGNRPPNLGH